MVSNAKSLAFLSLFVIAVFVMRDGDMSFTKPVSKTVFRKLYDYARPAEGSTCSGVSFTSSYSESEIKKSQSLESNLKKLRGGNPLQTLLEGDDVSGNFVSDYLMGLIGAIAVWAAFFVISLVLCCCAVCNWCCMFGCCKNCKCCRCCKRPTTTKRKSVYMYVTLFFMLAIFATGIAGAAFSGNISKGMKVSYCSILNLLEDLTYGIQSEKWLGIEGIIDGLQTFSDDLSTTLSNLYGQTATDSTATSYTNYGTALDDWYSRYNNYASLHLNRADPAESTNQYYPDYIANLGDKSTSGTWMYSLYVEATAKRDALSTAMSEVNSALGSIQTDSTQITDAINSGLSSAKTIADSMTSMISNLDGSTGDVVNNVVTIIGKVVLAFFIVFIVIAALSIASILLIKFLKIRFFSKVLHFNWCLLGFITIFSFLICAIFYPISIVFTEVCEVLVVSLTDGATFNSTLGNAFSSSSQQASDIMYTCLFGDGDALGTLGVTDSLDYFNTIYDQLDDLDSVIGLSTTDPAPSTALNYQTWYLGAVRDFLESDSVTATTVDLATLNKYANKATESCTTEQDVWKLSADNCTDSSYTTYASSSNDGSSNNGNPTCIGFDNWDASGGLATNRYTTSTYPTSSCSQVHSQDMYDYLDDFVANFKTNMQTINTQFTTIYNEFTANTGSQTYDVTYYEEQFGHDVYTSIQTFNNIKTQMQSVQDVLTGETNGVIPNSKCTFLGTDLGYFAEALCYGFITSIFQATIVLIIIGIFSFIGTISLFCLAKRINNEEDEHAKAITPGM